MLNPAAGNYFILLKELPMCETASQVILWRLQVLRHFKEGLTDPGGIMIYNYEAALRLGHSDWDGNDISPDSSDNDLDIQV